MRTFLECIPDMWGPKRATDSGAAARTWTGPNEISLTPTVNMALIMLSPQPKREFSLGSSRVVKGIAPVGAIEIIPAGADLFARWHTSKENMLFALGQDRLSHLASVEFENPDFEFHPPPHGPD